MVIKRAEENHVKSNHDDEEWKQSKAKKWYSPMANDDSEWQVSENLFFSSKIKWQKKIEFKKKNFHTNSHLQQQRQKLLPCVSVCMYKRMMKNDKHITLSIYLLI